MRGKIERGGQTFLTFLETPPRRCSAVRTTLHDNGSNAKLRAQLQLPGDIQQHFVIASRGNHRQADW